MSTFIINPSRFEDEQAASNDELSVAEFNRYVILKAENQLDVYEFNRYVILEDTP